MIKLILIVTDLLEFHKVPVLNPLGFRDHIDIAAKEEHEEVH